MYLILHLNERNISTKANHLEKISLTWKSRNTWENRVGQVRLGYLYNIYNSNTVGSTSWTLFSELFEVKSRVIFSWYMSKQEFPPSIICSKLLICPSKWRGDGGIRKSALSKELTFNCLQFTGEFRQFVTFTRYPQFAEKRSYTTLSLHSVLECFARQPQVFLFSCSKVLKYHYSFRKGLAVF